MEFILFMCVLFFMVFLLEKITDRLLGVKKRVHVSETPGKSLYWWGRVILFVICIFSLLFIYAAPIENYVKLMNWYWMFYFVMLLGLDAFLEWKYIKNSKQYLSSLIGLLYFIILLYNLEFFMGIWWK